MTDVDPAELSALVDGELETCRAAQVRAAMEADAQLQHQYEALMSIDARLHRMAGKTVLNVQIRLAPAQATAHAARLRDWRSSLILLLILATWTIGKLTAVMLLALASSACALAVLIIALVASAVREEAWRNNRAPAEPDWSG